MEYYAKFNFEKSPLSENSYILTEQSGTVKGLSFLKYSDNAKNIEAGIAGKEYIYFGVPRNMSIRRFFAHTFEGAGHRPITSTEALNNANRTFGDAKQIGLGDLILFQFSEDKSSLTMWFVKNLGYSRNQKSAAFYNWNKGEKLTAAEGCR